MNATNDAPINNSIENHAIPFQPEVPVQYVVNENEAKAPQSIIKSIMFVVLIVMCVIASPVIFCVTVFALMFLASPIGIVIIVISLIIYFSQKKSKNLK
jgi:hypothetical protein